MSSSTGQIFRITTFGESHGPGIGVVIDGCPPGLELDGDSIERELKRRRPGQSAITTQRKESDEFQILSGLYQGRTLGTPLTFFVPNRDVRSDDYLRWADIYRPSHADYTYDAKYGFRTPLGGGRASVRETIGRVAAGAVAGQILKSELGVETVAWVDSIGDVQSNLFENPPASRDEVDRFPVRNPDEKTAGEMTALIEETRKNADSLGGTIGVVVNNVPPGLGDPVFDKLEANLARACLSIPACKGFESGSGFRGARMRGSEHNDLFFSEGKAGGEPGGRITADTKTAATTGEGGVRRTVLDVPELKTRGNNSGGIQGGISNGMPVLLRLAFKPTATIPREQDSINEKGEPVKLRTGGRHDPCVLPRAVPIVEAVVNLVLVDAYLQQRAVNPLWWVRFASR